jgi:uncharacterized protein YgiM (DUF1202 family)
MKRTKAFFVIILLILLGVLFGNTVIASDREQRVQFAAPILVVNASFLNVRTGPGAQYPVLITVVGGTELPALAVASDFVWYQVSTVLGTGWVNVDFTIPRGDFTNVPVIQLSDITNVDTQSAAFLGQGGGVATVDVSGVPSTAPIGGTSCFATTASMLAPSTNLLLTPDANAQVLAVLFLQGSDVDYPVVGQSGQFVQLIVGGVGTGWVDSTQFRLRPSGAAGLTVVEVTDNLFITGSPYSAERPLSVTAGTEAFVIGQNGATYQLRLVSGDTFYVEIAKTRIRNSTSSDQQADVACTATTTASTTANTTVAGTIVLPTPSVTSGPHVVINTGFLNIRSGPGGQYSVVTTVNGGTELAVIGVMDDTAWFLVRGSFGQGFVDSEFVIFRGVIDVVPVIQYSSITTGTFAQPMVLVATSVTLFAAPGNNFGTIGTLAGPIQVPIVARSADGNWLQVNSVLGFGWVFATSVTVQGDLTLVPVVN